MLLLWLGLGLVLHFKKEDTPTQSGSFASQRRRSRQELKLSLAAHKALPDRIPVSSSASKNPTAKVDRFAPEANPLGALANPFPNLRFAN